MIIKRDILRPAALTFIIAIVVFILISALAPVYNQLNFIDNANAIAPIIIPPTGGHGVNPIIPPPKTSVLPIRPQPSLVYIPRFTSSPTPTDTPTPTPTVAPTTSIFRVLPRTSVPHNIAVLPSFVNHPTRPDYTFTNANLSSISKFKPSIEPMYNAKIHFDSFNYYVPLGGRLNLKVVSDGTGLWETSWGLKTINGTANVDDYEDIACVWSGATGYTSSFYSYCPAPSDPSNIGKYYYVEFDPRLDSPDELAEPSIATVTIVNYTYNGNVTPTPTATVKLDASVYHLQKNHSTMLTVQRDGGVGCVWFSVLAYRALPDGSSTPESPQDWSCVDSYSEGPGQNVSIELRGDGDTSASDGLVLNIPPEDHTANDSGDYDYYLDLSVMDNNSTVLGNPSHATVRVTDDAFTTSQVSSPSTGPVGSIKFDVNDTRIVPTMVPMVPSIRPQEAIATPVPSMLDQFVDNVKSFFGLK